MILIIDDNIQNSAWNNSRKLPSPGGQWRAYLNELVLKTLVSWLREDEDCPQVNSWLDQKTSTEIWEQVNGVTITIGNQRLIIIPSEDYDTSEIRVPQEWVDIPSWVGDYYIAAQVDLDEGEINFWGYASHKTLKEEGTYEIVDRSYSLKTNQLMLEVDVLWIALSLKIQPQTKAEVKPLLQLNQQELEDLSYLLGNPDLIFPRRKVPFEMWAGLLVSQLPYPSFRSHHSDESNLRVGLAVPIPR